MVNRTAHTINRDGAGNQQHIDQPVVKLQSQAQPGSTSLGCWQAVAAVLLQTAGNFLAAQARVGVDRQGLQGRRR